MGAIGVLLVVHCVAVYLLQTVALSSEKFTVTGLTRPVLAPLGGALELSCQLFPPQHAQHMEIRWFRNRYTQPVHLYRNGIDLHGETTSKYVERTKLLKDAIGEGKVTLRIFNVTIDDDGPYHCFFKDGEFYEEHITEVKVTVSSSDIQIHMHSPNIKGVMLECHSGGWFPQPHMEWRDSKGEVIPATTKSNSQDGKKLFNMTMALFIKANSHRNVTCYLQNLLTHQEESISIILPGELFSWKSVWIWIQSMITFVLIAFLMTSCVQCYLIHGSCSVINSPWKKKSAIVFVISMVAIIGIILILHLIPRVPVSDPHLELDTLWLEDFSVILFVLIVFKINFISFIYFRLDGCAPGCTAFSRKLKIYDISLKFACSLISSVVFAPVYLRIQTKASISDPLYSLYNSWQEELFIVICFLVAFFTITTTALSWTHLRSCCQAFVVLHKMLIQEEHSR